MLTKPFIRIIRISFFRPLCSPCFFQIFNPFLVISLLICLDSKCAPGRQGESGQEALSRRRLIERHRWRGREPEMEERLYQPPSETRLRLNDLFVDGSKQFPSLLTTCLLLKEILSASFAPFCQAKLNQVRNYHAPALWGKQRRGDEGRRGGGVNNGEVPLHYCCWGAGELAPRLKIDVNS